LTRIIAASNACTVSECQGKGAHQELPYFAAKEQHEGVLRLGHVFLNINNRFNDERLKSASMS